MTEQARVALNADPEPKPLPFAWRLPAAFGSGGALAVCFPPVGLPFLLPLCIGAFLFLLQGVTKKQAFYLGFAFGLAWFCGDLFWLSNLFGTAAISLCALLAFFPALFAGLFVWLQGRLPRVPVWLLAPLVWTGIEYYRSEPFILNFGWMGWVTASSIPRR